MHRLAIIPARAGSKGLKDKNIIDLCGKPLMAYSIEAAIQSEQFEHIVVSTDSKQYANIAKINGAEVLMREKRLSDDKATSFMVIEDVLKKMDIDSIDYFMLLQPTSPLRTAFHIREAIELFEKNYNEFDYLVSVKKAEFSSVLVKPIENDLSMKYFDTDFSNYRRQLHEEYSPNGAIFCGKPQEYLKQKHFFGARSIAYIMNDMDSVDIDNYIDYLVATVIMNQRI